jgi:hypothetical protein
LYLAFDASVKEARGNQLTGFDLLFAFDAFTV